MSTNKGNASKDLSEAMDDDDDDEDDDEKRQVPRSPSIRETRSCPHYRRGCILLRRDESRRDHLQTLFVKRTVRAEMMKLSSTRDLAIVDVDLEYEIDQSLLEDAEYMAQISKEVQLESEVEVSQKVQKIEGLLKQAGLDAATEEQFPLEVRVNGLTLTVPVSNTSNKIQTVYNSSFMLYPIISAVKRLWNKEPIVRDRAVTEKRILDGIKLVFQPGKSYLVLGPPGAGKSTLLKMVSGHWRRGTNDKIEGSIVYNGRTLHDKGQFFIENAFAYIDQLDKHAARLTVRETFDFSHRCKTNWRVARKGISSVRVQAVIAGLGLDGVSNTFVGDASVRGVSGGQRRRVTVGEMLTSVSPIVCGDEISTGLDASSTYDMIEVLLHFARYRRFTRIISLLQPSPETVSLFDEVILLAEGRVIFAGPVREVEGYFGHIGFVCPKFMDVADFLQMITTKEGSSLYDPTEEMVEHRSSSEAPSMAELADLFRNSEYGQWIEEDLRAPYQYIWKGDEGKVSIHGSTEISKLSMASELTHKYANNFFRTTQLVLVRFLKLAIRDKRIIFAGLAKNVIMGVSVGGCYWSTEDVVSIQGALFQAGLFIVLGAMQSSSSLLDDRLIFYKHTDANFYSAWPFVFGRTISQIPQTVFDTFTFSTIMYFFVGLADRDSASNYFIYLSILIVFGITISQNLTVFAAFADSGSLSALSACLVLLLILFGGFIVPPVAIPNYFSWLYWWNPFAWMYRGLIINEFRSERWGNESDSILLVTGFVDPKGQPFSQQWIGYTYAYLLPYSAFCSVVAALILTYVRNEGGDVAVQPDVDGCTRESAIEGAEVKIPFKPVTLSFVDICYDVKASTSSEQLRLLKNVNGVFRPHRMCALMGESGAGKTTLMDVIALRKRTGTISGQVYLNGWQQDAVSFRRCSGYVEQFDVQSPELTVRETILFSARLRLDSELVTNDAEIQAFVDQVMGAVELTSLADVVVGTDEGFGLSFEQKKRLSIAVELAASPSVVFLDEPTSGLDSRAAQLVVKTLRTIADSGRTVCATIHQPSSSVFEMFDDLLLLKKGGQVVFHGQLGKNSCHLVSYFESRHARKIELGDNPANWMLRVLDNTELGDLAEAYEMSENFATLKAELEEFQANLDPEEKIEYKKQYASGFNKRRHRVSERLRTIYWRSPTYNLSRILVSMIIAFVLGSSFITQRTPDQISEQSMRARIAVIFLTFIITGIMSQLSVLPVMTKIRDMFYRHSDSGMYDSGELGLALGTAEKYFIVYSSFVFTLVFLSTFGMIGDEPAYRRATRSIGFWGFYTFNSAIYSYFGQLFVCLVKPMATAIILSSVFIGLNNFFSGLVVRPQFMIGTFYVVPYYIAPGHYVYDGMLGSLYRENNATVVADQGSEFYDFLGCTGEPCTGTAEDYMNVFFGGNYGMSARMMVVDALVLGAFLIFSRLGTWVCLKFIRFGS